MSKSKAVTFTCDICKTAIVKEIDTYPVEWSYIKLGINAVGPEAEIDLCETCKTKILQVKLEVIKEELVKIIALI